MNDYVIRDSEGMDPDIMAAVNESLTGQATMHPCPYGDPECTGKHSGLKSQMCPSAYMLKKERRKDYYAANAEREKERMKAYRTANAERLKEYIKEYKKEWCKANPERRNAIQRKRRETKKARAGRYDSQVITEPTCHLCRLPIEPGDPTHVDHVIALNEVMPDSVLSGLRVCHASCNISRRDKPIAVFLLENLRRQ